MHANFHSIKDEHKRKACCPMLGRVDALLLVLTATSLSSAAGQAAVQEVHTVLSPPPPPSAQDLRLFRRRRQTRMNKLSQNGSTLHTVGSASPDGVDATTHWRVRSARHKRSRGHVGTASSILEYRAVSRCAVLTRCGSLIETRTTLDCCGRADAYWMSVGWPLLYVLRSATL